MVVVVVVWTLAGVVVVAARVVVVVVGAGCWVVVVVVVGPAEPALQLALPNASRVHVWPGSEYQRNTLSKAKAYFPDDFVDTHGNRSSHSRSGRNQHRRIGYQSRCKSGQWGSIH